MNEIGKHAYKISGNVRTWKVVLYTMHYLYSQRKVMKNFTSYISSTRWDWNLYYPKYKFRTLTLWEVVGFGQIILSRVLDTFYNLRNVKFLLSGWTTVLHMELMIAHLDEKPLNCYENDAYSVWPHSLCVPYLTLSNRFQSYPIRCCGSTLQLGTYI